MTPKQVEGFTRRHALPHLPGWRARGRDVYLAPVGDVYAAVLFDRRMYDADRFRLTAYVTPLYVPSEGLPLTASKVFDDDFRIPPGRAAAAGGAAAKVIRTRATRWLKARGTPAAFARLRLYPGPNQLEARCYGLVLARAPANQIRAALGDAADRLAAAKADHPDLWDGWMEAARRRLGRVRKAQAADPQSAVALIRRWRDAKAAAHRLD
jgi:hypothetical protein